MSATRVRTLSANRGGTPSTHPRRQRRGDGGATVIRATPGRIDAFGRRWPRGGRVALGAARGARALPGRESRRGGGPVGRGRGRLERQLEIAEQADFGRAR